MAARVIRLSLSPREFTILRQRRPPKGISSMISKVANPAQRKSNSGMVEKTWLKSICRDTYQKHPPVTNSLAAKIAIFSRPPPRDGRGV
jgi:hypothetical protein